MSGVAGRDRPALVVRPLPTEVEVASGDDVAALLLDALDRAGVRLRDGDVLAVASKVVAKAEGAVVPLPPAADVHTARRALASQQARRVVADSPWVLVVETHHGLVCANAGIDTSNLAEDGFALLLPADPDASAAALRTALTAATGADVGVVVTDTFGRPWRLGQTDVAIGAAGVRMLRDDRGTEDRHGRRLEVTQAAVGDALAAAADLVRGKADGTPFVLLRGLDLTGDDTAAVLRRPSSEDLFRVGGRTAALEVLTAGAAARRRPDELVDTAVDEALVEALTAAVASTGDAATVVASDHGVELVGEGEPLGAARTAALAVVAAWGLGAAVARTPTGLDLTIGTIRH